MEETVATLRSDLMNLFREESKRRDERLQRADEELDQRARYLSYKESELHDLFVQRKKLRFQLLEIQSGLERIIRTIERCKQEDIRQETNIDVLKSENQKLNSEVSELREKHACGQREINSLIHLLNN